MAAALPHAHASSASMHAAAQPAHAARRHILARGCDPVRAAFAKKQWEPILGVTIDSATSDQELVQRLTSGTRYDVFFIAPGQCQLIRMGVIDGDAMKALVRKHQPDCKILMINDVSKGLPMIADALGMQLGPADGGLPSVKPMSEEWPFYD